MTVSVTSGRSSPSFWQREGSHKHDWSIPLYCPSDEYFGGTHTKHVATWVCSEDMDDTDPDCWVDVPYCCENTPQEDER